MAKYASKIVLLGDGAVGKTSLVRRYVEQTFSDDYIATIGVNVKKKLIKDLDLNMSIWDIYGQKSINPGDHSSNYVGAKGALVVFDLTRKKTFMHLKGWIEDLYDVTGKIPVVLLGNKNDIIKDFEDDRNTIFTKASKKEFHRYMIEEHYYKSIFSKDTRFIPVPYSLFDKWAENNVFEISFPHLLTSAKIGENVEKAFRTLGKLIIKNKIRYS